MVCRSTSSYSSGRKLRRKSWQTAPVRRGGCKQYPKNLSPAVPAWKPMVDTLRIFCNCREAVGRQPHITKPCSYNNLFFFWCCCVDSSSVGLVVPLSFALNVCGIFFNYSAHPSSCSAQKRVSAYWWHMFRLLNTDLLVQKSQEKRQRCPGSQVRVVFPCAGHYTALFSTVSCCLLTRFVNVRDKIAWYPQRNCPVFFPSKPSWHELSAPQWINDGRTEFEYHWAHLYCFIYNWELAQVHE
jgi:hypothetical protein